MKKSVLLFLSFVFFSNVTKAQCPTGLECYEAVSIIANELTYTVKPSDDGSCYYYLDIEGIPEDYIPCLNLELSVVPQNTLADYPDIEQGVYPDINHFNIDLSHHTNAPVPYVFVLSYTWNGQSTCSSGIFTWVQEYELQCCSDNEFVGIDLNVERIDCGPDGCTDNFTLDINNLTGFTIDWDIPANGACPSPSITDGVQNQSVTFGVCEDSYTVTVLVVDEYGCEYYEEVIIECTDCGDPCDPEPLNLDVVVELEYCEPFPGYPEFTQCFFNLEVLGAPATATYTWWIDGGAFAGNPASISRYAFQGATTGFVEVIANDPCYSPLVDTVYFDLNCEENCGNGNSNGNGNGENFIGGNTSSGAFKIIPNPVSLSANTNLTVQLGELPTMSTDLKLTVMDLNGKTMNSFKVDDSWNGQVTLGEYIPGMYIITLSDGKQVLQAEKIVVTK